MEAKLSEILILSNKWDVSVDFVVRELRKRGQAFLRLNTEDFVSEKVFIGLPKFQILVSKQSVTYDITQDISVIWNRRPGRPFDDTPVADRPSLATQRFVNEQWYSWLEGLQLLPDVTWVNHPQANSRMESKVRQLKLASSLGFSIPNTIISNDPKAARAHLKKLGSTAVVKALYSPLIEEPEQDYFIFTNSVTEADLEDEANIRLCPIIFQESLIPKTDYRVTVVGETVIPVKINTAGGSQASLDWRTQKEGLVFRQCNLPSDVENLCLQYVQESGLLFGAIDLVEHRGGWYFLEVNPNGEWGWLQKPHGVPIAESLCDLMIEKARAVGGTHEGKIRSASV